MKGSTLAGEHLWDVLKTIKRTDDPVVYTQMAMPSGDVVTFRIELVDISKVSKPN